MPIASVLVLEMTTPTRSAEAVCRDIAPGRHGGATGSDLRGSSNYLFADGHVENWKAIDVKRRVDGGENIALPPGIER